MNRFLPLIMLLAGLVLAVTAFASAHAAQPSLADSEAQCILEAFSPDPRPEPSELRKCWHLVGMGKIVTTCQPEPITEQSAATAIPECKRQRIGAMLPVNENSRANPLEAPPPKV